MGNYNSTNPESISPEPSDDDETQSNGIQMDIRRKSPTPSNRTMIISPPPSSPHTYPAPSQNVGTNNPSPLILHQPTPIVRTKSMPDILNATTNSQPPGIGEPVNPPNTIPAFKPRRHSYESYPSYPVDPGSYYPTANAYPATTTNLGPDAQAKKKPDPEKLKQYRQKTKQFQYSINCTQKQPYGYGYSYGYGYGAKVPGYAAPGYGSSGYGTSGYGAPGYGAPGYGSSGYGALGYGAPGYGVPSTGTVYSQGYPYQTTGVPLPENEVDIDKGWTRPNIRVVKYYVSFLSYMSLVYHFYFFKLKKIEGYWSWAIIVLSSLTSALSLFQYHEEKPELDLIVKIFLTTFSLIITLISAWLKKQNYVERIAEIGKYSIKINKLKNTVKSILEEPIDTRILYKDFQLEHKKNIIEYISNRPLISPYEWKETVYIISKYYPELAAYEFPWNKVDGYGGHFMNTFKKLKYNTCWKRIKNCYYCKSKCMCKQGDADRQESLDILDRDIKFYRSLPKYDLDYNPYRPKDEIADEKGNTKRRYSYSDSDVSEKYEWEDEIPSRYTGV